MGGIFNERAMDERTMNVGGARACACGWPLPAAAVPVRARTGSARTPVRVTLDEVEGQRVVDAYVALACPVCGAGHVLHTVDSAVRAGLVETDLTDRELAARAGSRGDVVRGPVEGGDPWEPVARELAVALDALRDMVDDRGDGEEVRLEAVTAYEAHCAKLAVPPWPHPSVDATFELVGSPVVEPVTPAPARRPLTPYRMELAAAGHCMADCDGDCTWEGCPQLRDGEPLRTGRHCPRDVATRARLDPDDEGRAGG